MLFKLIDNCLGKFFRSRQYRITGACKGCGECCRGVVLQITYKYITSEKEFEKVKEHYPEYSVFEISGKNSFGELIFSCTKLDKNNRCTIYETRPKVCREYPTEKMAALNGSVLDNCGYKIEPLVPFKKILAQKIKQT